MIMRSLCFGSVLLRIETVSLRAVRTVVLEVEGWWKSGQFVCEDHSAEGLPYLGDFVLKEIRRCERIVALD